MFVAVGFCLVAVAIVCLYVFARMLMTDLSHLAVITELWTIQIDYTAETEVYDLTHSVPR